MPKPKKKHDVASSVDIKKGHDGSPDEVRITDPSVAFAVFGSDGFGQIVVQLKPGQRETLMVNGHLVTVIRDYVQ